MAWITKSDTYVLTEMSINDSLTTKHPQPQSSIVWPVRKENEIYP